MTASYAAEVLKPRFNTREVSKEDYKWVLRKTVEKARLVQNLCMPLPPCIAPDSTFSNTAEDAHLQRIQSHTL